VVERKKELNNMTGQELKEMITNQKIKLEDLDIEKLNRLFEYESTVICNNEGDSELLLRCADLLAEKEGFAEEHDKQFQEMLQAAMHNVPVTARRRKRYGFKKALLIAAAVALLVGSLSVVAVAFGCDIFAYFREIITRPAGATMEKEAVTLTHNGEAKEYSSMEELVRTERLEILYPAVLPESISVTEVRLLTEADGKETVEIQTTDEQTRIYVHLEMNNAGEPRDDSERLVVNGEEFYVRAETCSAVSYISGNFYSIQASNYEDLMKILNNLKEN
jgi:cell division protein FtsL